MMTKMGRDINDIMPKIPGMRWGAVMNRPPTNRRLDEMNKMFSDGKWHMIYDDDDDDVVYIDGYRIQKHSDDRYI